MANTLIELAIKPPKRILPDGSILELITKNTSFGKDKIKLIPKKLIVKYNPLIINTEV